MDLRPTTGMVVSVPWLRKLWPEGDPTLTVHPGHGADCGDLRLVHWMAPDGVAWNEQTCPEVDSPASDEVRS